MSDPGAVSAASTCPASITSITGHGFGLRWQNNRNSNATSLGRMARLAWTKWGAIPDVGL